jgi:catechol 2,3-dioxygenase-like lactoylglutathione lyase family enzyme
VTNTLIFVDLASEDPDAAGKFYAEVFGWENDARPKGEYHRMVPGGFFKKSDGTDSEIGNLHLGIFKAANARPHPEPGGVEPRGLSTDGRKPRIWVLISDDDSADRILGTAVKSWAPSCCGATTTGPSSTATTTPSAIPWGNEIVLVGQGGSEPGRAGELHAGVAAHPLVPT